MHYGSNSCDNSAVELAVCYLRKQQLIVMGLHYVFCTYDSEVLGRRSQSYQDGESPFSLAMRIASDG